MGTVLSRRGDAIAEGWAEEETKGVDAHTWFLWKSDRKQRARCQPPSGEVSAWLFLFFWGCFGGCFFPASLLQEKKKKNLSLLDQNDFLLLSWAAGTVCAGLTLRAPPARSPPPQNLPGACVGRGTKRTENPLGSGFAVQGGINPGTAAARSLPTGLGIFQQEAAAICTGRDAPQCSVSMGRGQG